MVGQDGTRQPLIERWTGGGNWAVVPAPPVGTGDLVSVAAASATSAWAVGSFQDSSGNGHGLILHWDGSNWTQVTAPGDSKSLDAVTAVSAGDVWVAGDDTSGQAYLAHYDGTNWIQKPSNVSGQAFVSDLTATSSSDVWAVGAFDPAQTHPLILHWDGTQWSQSLVSDLPQAASLTSVSASSPADAWAVGNGGANGAATAGPRCLSRTPQTRPGPTSAVSPAWPPSRRTAPMPWAMRV
jgi:hypothetical protein